MQINEIADRLRKFLPGAFWNPIRKLGNSVLGPMYFSVQTGHLRSSLLSKSVDYQGNPIPWFTYPAIEFLLAREQLLGSRRVLEWGAGQSTLWWARRSKQVVAFEDNREWYDYLHHTGHQAGNMKVHLVKPDLQEAPDLLAGQRFDLAVIDGLDRFRATEISLAHLEADGVLLVDNADGNHGPQPGCGIIQLLHREGYSRIDFCGFVPGNAWQHCTSLFYRGDCFLTRLEDIPRPRLTWHQWDTR